MIPQKLDKEDIEQIEMILELENVDAQQAHERQYLKLLFEWYIVQNIVTEKYMKSKEEILEGLEYGVLKPEQKVYTKESVLRAMDIYFEEIKCLEEIPLENIFKSPLSTTASREFWKRYFTENNFKVIKA